jgi:hypothetical protein
MLSIQIQTVSFPVMRLMARDYLPIPASSCLAERSFSMSARTDDSRRGLMQDVRFSGLQRIRDGHRDGRFVPEEEALKPFRGDFILDFNHDDM